MNFRFDQEEERFRQDIRDFLKHEWSDSIQAQRAEMKPGSDEAHEFALEFARRLGKKGWLVGHWPRAYGGQGWSYERQLIYNEEMAYCGAPRGDSVSRQIAGPSIMSHGTEEQKRQHLPPIARAERVWCQGFSEPDAGSDLWNIKTRARRAEDGFIVSGQKVWTTNAHRADWCVLLARTDPEAKRSEGITYFLMDMKLPGVNVRPLMIAGLGYHAAEVFLDGVFISDDCVLGGADQIGKGRNHAVHTMEFERSGIAGAASARRVLEQLVKYVKETRVNGKPLSTVPAVRHDLAELAADIEVAQLLSYRIGWMQSTGKRVPYEASQGKVFSSELSQRIAAIATRIMGLYSQLEMDSRWTLFNGKYANLYLATAVNTVGGGTSEIQRTTIALRGLGLPLQ
jgi:alkylation response protein AidB-like acyl-CoA dehydrogenase